MTAPVKWLGHSAVYTTDERAILAALPVREQAFLHTLKAFTEGELEEQRPSDPEGNCLFVNGLTDTPVASSTTADKSGNGARQTSVGVVPDRPQPPNLYTDPEDIPFGAGVQTPRKPSTYALVWTWRKHREFPYKSSKFPWKSAEHKKAVWKKWYERQGWKVSSHADGYFARHPSGQSHSISLHEYDRETNERLR